jgi:hypothetical protein
LALPASSACSQQSMSSESGEPDRRRASACKPPYCKWLNEMSFSFHVLTVHLASVVYLVHLVRTLVLSKF